MQIRPVFNAETLHTALTQLKNKGESANYIITDIEQRIMLAIDVANYAHITAISGASDNLYYVLNDDELLVGVINLNQVGNIISAATYNSDSGAVIPQPMHLTLVNGENEPGKPDEFYVSANGSFSFAGMNYSNMGIEVNDFVAMWNERIQQALSNSIFGEHVGNHYPLCKVVIKGLGWERVEWIWFLRESSENHTPYIAFEQMDSGIVSEFGEQLVLKMPSINTLQGYVEREGALSTNPLNPPPDAYHTPIHISFNYKTLVGFDFLRSRCIDYKPAPEA